MNRTGRRAALLTAALLAVVGATGCGSDNNAAPTPPGAPAVSGATGQAAPTLSQPVTGPAGPTTPGVSPSAGSVVVNVQNFAFSPATVTVPVGATVTWRFVDPVQHNVTADDQSFKSADLSSGQSFSTTFSKAGTFAYSCTIHPFMKGTVTVR